MFLNDHLPVSAFCAWNKFQRFTKGLFKELKKPGFPVEVSFSSKGEVKLARSAAAAKAGIWESANVNLKLPGVVTLDKSVPKPNFTPDLPCVKTAR